LSRGLAIVAAVVVLLIAVPLFYLDSLAKDALESGASETFGTRTTLGSVSLGLLSGKVGLSKLRVRNPEGWEEKYFFSIGDGRFGVNLRDFLGEQVTVPQLVVDDVYLSLERSTSGSNYGTILANMQKGAKPAPAKSEKPGKRFVIRDVSIRNVEADLRFDAPGPADQELKVLIPEIRLHDLGSETQGGMLVSQLWATVVRAVLTAVVRQGGGPAAFITRDLAGGLARLGGVPIEVVGDVTRVGSEAAVEVGKKAGEAVGEATGGALGDAGQLGEEAGGAVKRGLGGLLDRKKD
jgi:hypothetical protein